MLGHRAHLRICLGSTHSEEEERDEVEDFVIMLVVGGYCEWC